MLLIYIYRKLFGQLPLYVRMFNEYIHCYYARINSSELCNIVCLTLLVWARRSFYTHWPYAALCVAAKGLLNIHLKYYTRVHKSCQALFYNSLYIGKSIFILFNIIYSSFHSRISQVGKINSSETRVERIHLVSLYHNIHIN